MEENAPADADWVFWLKSRVKSLKHPNEAPMIYIASQHLHGPHVSDLSRQISMIKDTIYPKLPSWIDALMWHSEWYEIPLDIELVKKMKSRNN